MTAIAFIFSLGRPRGAKLEGGVTNNGNAVTTPLQRLWPGAGLAVALLANIVWIGLLGYALIKLL